MLTMLIDNMGLDEQWGGYLVNNPRGITKYELSGHEADVISWKITGNVGGEYYLDKARGPLNEGRLYAERHGFHRPSPPSNLWKTLARWTDYIPQVSDSTPRRFSCICPLAGIFRFTFSLAILLPRRIGCSFM